MSKAIQGVLDEFSADTLLLQLDSYGQACLTTLASSNDTSSWLRAPPIPSLGLSMPPNEFPLTVRIWLEISSFPSTPALLCPCGSVIDPNGDHLLSCSFQDQTHDAIRDIIYEALLLDNQSVKREQSASNQSRNRPGDILIFLMAALRILIFLCVTCSLLATSPLLLLEQLVCVEKLLKMLSTFLR